MLDVGIVHDNPPRGRDEVLRHDRADRYLATVPTCKQTCGVTQWVTGTFDGDSASSLFCLLSNYLGRYLGRFVGHPGRCQLANTTVGLTCQTCRLLTGLSQESMSVK